MAQARKRRRLEGLDLPAHIDKINAGEIIGTYEEVDLVQKHFALDELTLKYKERDDFEFNALLLDGMTTGWARCTSEKCRERMMNGPEKSIVFMCNQENRSGMQRRFLERHLRYYHKTEEEIEEANKKRKESRLEARLNPRRQNNQPSMLNFAKRPSKCLGSDDVTELKALNAAVIASKNLSMDFFVSEEMLERDEYLLKSVGVDPSEVHRFNRGSGAVKSDLFKAGSANWRLIKTVGPRLAEKSRLTILIDHQKILQLTNESDKDAIGCALVLTATDMNRYQFFLAYDTVKSTRTPDTVKHVNEVAKVRFKMRFDSFFCALLGLTEAHF